MVWKIIFLVYIIVPSGFGIMDEEIAIYDSLESNRLIINPIISTLEQTGYTLCLRVQFKYWINEEIVSSSFFSLKMINLKTGIGELGNFKFKHTFNWTGVIPISLSFWNSICASFNSTDLTLILLVNGQILLNTTEKSSYIKSYLNDLMDTSIQLGLGNFSALITDLNVWSRPLSVTDLYKYSSGCSTNAIEILKPDKVIWSRLKIINKNNSNSKSIPKVDLCENLSFTITTDTIILHGPFSNYETAYRFCKDFKGNMQMKMNWKNLLLQMKSGFILTFLQCNT